MYNNNNKKEFSYRCNNLSYPSLDIRDIAIINAFPIYDCEPIVLNVGCGGGRIDFHLRELGYKVYATDIKKREIWEDVVKENSFLKFSEASIFDIESFPIKNAPIVICSEVLEHLIDYKRALKNLIKITQTRLIITIPFEESFGGRYAPPPEGHCNLWSDRKKLFRYKNINEFHELCRPYSVAISKIRTKPEDVEMRQYCFLIVVDKKQEFNF